MIVVIEGVDASGKSTLCGNLQRNYGGITYATPPKKILKERGMIDHFATSQESFWFYQRGIKIAAKEIQELKKSSKYLFIDRYWISTAATHTALGISGCADKLKQYECADLTILLSISPDVQLQRFRQRGMTTGDKNLLPLFHAVSANFHTFVQQYCCKYVIISTDNLTIENTLDHAISALYA